MFKEERKRSYQGFGLCLLVFLIGLFMLNVISITENPILGNAFYIIIGWLFMLLSVIGVCLIIHYLYKLKRRERKRKSGSKIVFLDDEGDRRKKVK
ncbi:MAG: hypothetical protein EOO50_14565 [Flavobacterium sp.]|uniref:hypothetical protein n=1 Tax=Flavobacterium sp. TaxID=239 RepID=UPI0011FA3D40|nr:hypothetical protein [Flavobacterium sp.]RZJ65247.1 MAG: hypothetical protein EOO50_14565 [Flavobacterium sp.]